MKNMHVHSEHSKLDLPIGNDHNHCQNCIKVKECKAKGAKTGKCLIIDCPSDCGFMFHKCKLPEHALLCLNARVPCINSGNGCPFTMPRKEQGKHLESCPASVVVCTVEWNRWLTWKNGPQFPYQSLKQGQLDADLAQSDARAVIKSFKNPMWRRQYQQYCNNFFPAIPISTYKDGVELIFTETQDGMSSQENSPGEMNTNSSDEVTDCDFDQEQQCYSTNEKVCTFVSNETSVSNPSVSNKNEGTILKKSDNTKDTLIDTFLEFPSLLLPSSFSLSLTIDRLPKCQSKSMCTFLCAQELRRDEYGWHYKNVHCDIQGGLDGWLEYRCPLAQYGCSYSIKRLHPSKLGASIVHNEELESFGFKENMVNVEETDCNSVEQLNLAELPFEILGQICLYLDSFSLCNLSKSCRRLRAVCVSRLKKRGIILQRWRKTEIDGKISWKPSKAKWDFSSAFSPVETWVHTDSGSMSDHLHNCAYNIRQLYDEQYYRVTPHELARQLNLMNPEQKRKLTSIKKMVFGSCNSHT